VGACAAGALARAREERGFGSIWAPEHSHIPASRQSPWPGGAELPKHYWHTMDPFVALTVAAMASKTIRVATGICLLIQRDPIHTAKQVASVDLVSNGRFIFGIGAGWNREEMEDHGTNFKRRWRLLRERVLAMKEIWRNEKAAFHGEFVNFEPMWSWPKPVQTGGPPILLGSEASKAFERVVDYCDGWMPIMPPDEAEQKIAALYLCAYSRAPDSCEVAAATDYVERAASHANCNEQAAAMRHAYEDLIWALLNTKEFSFNH